MRTYGEFGSEHPLSEPKDDHWMGAGRGVGGRIENRRRWRMRTAGVGGYPIGSMDLDLDQDQDLDLVPPFLPL